MRWPAPSARGNAKDLIIQWKLRKKTSSTMGTAWR